MKVEYDRSADALYIYIVDVAEEDVERTYPCDPVAVRGEINLDFGKDGRLLGIEVQGASKMVPDQLLEIAQAIE